jgi:hypothetical protein
MSLMPWRVRKFWMYSSSGNTLTRVALGTFPFQSRSVLGSEAASSDGSTDMLASLCAAGKGAGIYWKPVALRPPLQTQGGAA